MGFPGWGGGEFLKFKMRGKDTSFYEKCAVLENGTLSFFGCQTLTWQFQSGAPNEISWQISAPQPGVSWLARETEQIQNTSWQTENTTIQ